MAGMYEEWPTAVKQSFLRGIEAQTPGKESDSLLLSVDRERWWQRLLFCLVFPLRYQISLLRISELSKGENILYAFELVVSSSQISSTGLKNVTGLDFAIRNSF